MSRVSIMYIGEGQRYRRQKVPFSMEFPTFLINDHDRQAHILGGGPLWMKQRPVALNTWDELVKATPPRAPAIVEQRLMVIEDNSPWPVVPRPWTDRVERDRIQQRTQQEAYQWAETVVARDRTQQNLMEKVGLTACAIAACAALGIFAIIATRAF